MCVCDHYDFSLFSEQFRHAISAERKDKGEKRNNLRMSLAGVSAQGQMYAGVWIPVAHG